MLQKQTTRPSHNNNKKKGEGISFLIYVLSFWQPSTVPRGMTFELPINSSHKNTITLHLENEGQQQQQMAFTRGYVTIPFSVSFMKEIVPSDQDYDWSDAEQDETGYIAIYLRCAKSIAIGRVCNTPAYYAYNSYANNNKPRYNSVGRVSIRLLAGDSPY